MVYAFGFGINTVLHVAKKIYELYNIKQFRSNIFTNVNPSLLEDSFNMYFKQPEFYSEEDLINVLEGVKIFYLEEALPFFEKYGDVQVLDAMINSPEDRWIKEKRSFPGIGYLPVYRLIIAKLAGRPDFDDLVEFNYDAIQIDWKDFDRNDGSLLEVIASRYLQSHSVEELLS